MADDAQYVSRYSSPQIGIVTNVSGVPGDIDGNVVTVTMRDLNGTVVVTRQADHEAVGVYSTTLSSAETQTPGRYTVTWDFSVNGVPQSIIRLLDVGDSAPAYDALDPNARGVIEAVWDKFEDAFDSPYGGPNLQTYFQSKFNRNRLAKLLRTAMGKLNTVAQPYATFSLDPGGKVFPYAQWGPLLEQALYIETIKHLVRSYTEQPATELAAGVSRVDRRDYTQRWLTVLEMEEGEFRSQLDTFKISQMGLGRARVLVSGGVYGNYYATPIPNMAARARYWGAWF